MDINTIFFQQKNSPATEYEIKYCENNIIGNIPEIYKIFLRVTNGIVLNQCVLYDTDSLAEMYRVNEFAEYAPKYISIGNDNGGRELIIKAENDACLCGFVGAGAIGSFEPDEWFDFETWIEAGCKIPEKKDCLSSIGSVVIASIPNDKLTFLKETKQIFSLSISTATLLKEVSSLPYIIANEMYGSKATKLIAKTSYPECYKFIATEQC